MVTKVNVTKTKYMHLIRNKKKTIHELKIGEYKFEGILGLHIWVQF
jgi:hypothetical protein